MQVEAIKQLIRAKNLINSKQYEGAIACIDSAITHIDCKSTVMTADKLTVGKVNMNEVYIPPKQHCSETCEEPGGYCECKSQLNNGE